MLAQTHASLAQVANSAGSLHDGTHQVHHGPTSTVDRPSPTCLQQLWSFIRRKGMTHNEEFLFQRSPCATKGSGDGRCPNKQADLASLMAYVTVLQAHRALVNVQQGFKGEQDEVDDNKRASSSTGSTVSNGMCDIPQA